MAEISPTPQRRPTYYAYSRQCLGGDNTLDDNLPASRPRPFTNRFYPPPETNLGTLVALPPEIILDILPQLDLRSLATFRGVNRRATEFVDSLPQYKAIVKHASHAITAILSIGTNPWISCQTLYDKLCTHSCERPTCRRFGGYLYLITCKRVCFTCFTLKDLYLPLEPEHAGRKFGLDLAAIETLPRMITIPGTYTMAEMLLKSVSLVDYESARCAGIAFHGSVDEMNKYVHDRQARELEEYQEAMALARHGGSIVSRPPLPQTRDRFDSKWSNTHRFAAIVRVPWMDRASHEVELGFYCVGCSSSSLHRRLFTKSSFARHIKKFGEIVGVKHQLNGDGSNIESATVAR